MATINGTEIDLMPTAGMREEAQRFKDWRAEGKKGGTEVAVRRANQILSGNELDPNVVIEMSAWFARHESDKDGQGFRPNEEGYPSRGRLSWSAWGGDAGKSFSDRKSAKIKELRSSETMAKTKRAKTKRAEPDELSVGDSVRWNASGGIARGVITSIERDGTINVPNSDFEITGTEDDPAALITVYREVDGDFEETDVQVGHKFSTLTKINSLRSVTTLYKRSGETSFETVEDRTYSIPFSSEHPVERSFGTEILSHEEGSIDFSRLNGGVAPVLWNHNMDELIGIVRSAYLDTSKDKKKGRAVIELSRNPRAQEIQRDIEDGIIRSISVGYGISEMEEEEIEGNSVFVAKRWMPYEISLVSSPADPSATFGRSLIEPNTMPSVEKSDIVEDKRIITHNENLKKEIMSTNQEIEVVRSEAEKSATSKERTRISQINATCARHGFDDLAEQMIANGSSVDACREAILERINAKPVETVKPVEEQLSKKERQYLAKDYKVSALLRGAITGDWSSYGAGFAKEIHEELSRNAQSNQNNGGFFVPFSALRATYNTATANQGGNLVPTDLRGDDFIQELRSSSKMVELGTTVLTGLTGDVAIPRASGVASSAYLSSETASISQSEGTFDQITMTPKTLASFSKFSRNMVIQATGGIENIVRAQLQRGINVGLDSGIISGSGSSGQPTGILNQSGINSVAMGTNGGAITLDKIVDLETAMMEDNAAVNPDSVAYVTNAKVMGAIKKLKTSGGEYIVNNNLAAIGRGETPLAVNGYPIAMTNNVPSNLTKGSSSGVCSALILADFTQVVLGIFGGGVEISVGESGDDFQKNLTSVKAVVAFDVALQHAESVAAIVDITT